MIYELLHKAEMMQKHEYDREEGGEYTSCGETLLKEKMARSV
ncbi:hypothetical protein SSYIS1_29600 [Serratia symbiotica]|uniref:Uncharacterized protein n=1 Tax=Serratia symbiotica TaxID=138074 RepID=A0A455VK14_9GAMM|nr:hypothetical protein SSYIS1_29600 [Serratia symbiotica]